MDRIRRPNKGNKAKGGPIGCPTAERILKEKKERLERQERYRNGTKEMH